MQRYYQLKVGSQLKDTEHGGGQCNFLKHRAGYYNIPQEPRLLTKSLSRIYS